MRHGQRLINVSLVVTRTPLNRRYTMRTTAAPHWLFWIHLNRARSCMEREGGRSGNITACQGPLNKPIWYLLSQTNSVQPIFKCTLPVCINCSKLWRSFIWQFRTLLDTGQAYSLNHIGNQLFKKKNSLVPFCYLDMTCFRSIGFKSSGLLNRIFPFPC